MSKIQLLISLHKNNKYLIAGIRQILIQPFHILNRGQLIILAHKQMHIPKTNIGQIILRSFLLSILFKIALLSIIKHLKLAGLC